MICIVKSMNAAAGTVTVTRQSTPTTPVAVVTCSTHSLLLIKLRIIKYSTVLFCREQIFFHVFFALHNSDDSWDSHCFLMNYSGVNIQHNFHDLHCQIHECCCWHCHGHSTVDTHYPSGSSHVHHGAVPTLFF